MNFSILPEERKQWISAIFSVKCGGSSLAARDMIESFLSSKEILTSFLGTLLALFSAGIIWIMKSAYEKHKAEVLALAKFERMFAFNLTTLKDNYEFIDKWVAAMSGGRPYSYHFDLFLTNEENTYKLSNLKLINEILSLNYKLRRTGLDIQNIYKEYWNVIAKLDSISDPQMRELSLLRFHQATIDALKELKKNEINLEENIINVVANIREVARVRYHSLFGYVALLFTDVLPKVNQVLINNDKLLLKKQIDERGRPQTGTVK